MDFFAFAVYEKDTGYTGVNIPRLFKTFEEACAGVDSYIDMNDTCAYVRPECDYEKLKYALAQSEHNYVEYVKLPYDDLTFIYSIVKLTLIITNNNASY